MARILVVGGSLGGLMVANMLLREGHDVRVLEKIAGSLDGRGAGIVSHIKLEEGLRRAGLDANASLGVTVANRVLLNARGEVEMRVHMPQLFTSWSRLYHLLYEIFPQERYVQSVSVRQVQSDEKGVHVQCGAQTWEADLLIASDGIRSAVRQQFAPDIQPQYAGYVAWRGVCDESALSPGTRASVFDEFGFCLPPGEQFVAYPVAGAGNALEPGRRAYNFVWYRPAPDGPALRDLLTDDEGNYYPHGIPPAKVSSRLIAALRQVARELLAPQFAEVVEKTTHPFLQAIYDVKSRQIAFGRVALMGDASFVARPHVGAGVTKAAEDAMALADSIREFGATPEALADYERKRLAIDQAIVGRAQWLGIYLQGWSAQDMKIASLRDPKDAVNDTAVEMSTLSLETMIPPQGAAVLTR